MIQRIINFNGNNTIYSAHLDFPVDYYKNLSLGLSS